MKPSPPKAIPIKVNYRIDEVAEILRVCQRTVRRLIAKGEIDAFKVLNCTLVSGESINAYRDNQIRKYKLENGFL